MKRLPFALAASTAVFLAFGLTACGDDVTKVEESGITVSSAENEADLPACATDINGTFVITKDKQKVFVCYSEKWFTLNGNDGSPAQSPTADSTATGKKGADGKNGTDGSDGTYCTGVAFESGDSTGFKIVCGKDTLGVILDGNDGKDGLHGVVSGLAGKLVQRMKRGINYSVFTMPSSQFKGFNDNGYFSDWALWIDSKNSNRIEKKHFKMIADKGFDHIRFQVKWDNHFVGDSSKCQIDPEYMKQIKWAVENSIANGLIAVVNEHTILYQMPTGNSTFNGNGYNYAQASPCEKEIYKQIAQSMSEFSPDSMIIELPNEPNIEPYITAKQWNGLVDSLIQIVHSIDPARVIIVGPRSLYSKDYLNELQLDNSDGLLMASFHYYEPFKFTSGDCNVTSSPDTSACGNEKWSASNSRKMAIYNDFRDASDWSKASGIPIYLGEYGTSLYTKDTSGAEKWLTTILAAADYYGFATSMHNFGSDYYVYYFTKDKWAEYKLRALFKPDPEYDATINENPILPRCTHTIDDFTYESFPEIYNSYISFLPDGRSWYFYTNYATVKNFAGTTIVNPANNIQSFIAVNDDNPNNYDYSKKVFYAKFLMENPADYPSYGLGLPLDEFDATDKVFEFSAKGSGKIKLAFKTAGVDTIRSSKWVGDFAAEFNLTPEWKRYTVWKDNIVPERSSVLDSLDAKWSEYGKRTTGIAFTNGTDVAPGKDLTTEWDITLLYYNYDCD